MDNKLNKKALIISLIFALFSCGLIISYISNVSKAPEEEPMVKLLVASRNILVGEQINVGDITAIEVPTAAVPQGIINDRESVENLYAQENIILGEPFRQERITEWENLTLSFNIPEGKRAISVYVDENSVFSNQLRVADNVDIIGNYSIETEDSKTIHYSRIVVQNIRIMAIGPSRIQKNTDNTEQLGDEDQLPRTVTLLVNPEEAEKIAYTSSFANFSIVLRGNGDSNNMYSQGILLNDLLPESMLNELTAVTDDGEEE